MPTLLVLRSLLFPPHHATNYVCACARCLDVRTPGSAVVLVRHDRVTTLLHLPVTLAWSYDRLLKDFVPSSFRYLCRNVARVVRVHVWVVVVLRTQIFFHFILTAPFLSIRFPSAQRSAVALGPLLINSCIFSGRPAGPFSCPPSVPYLCVERWEPDCP